MITITTPAKVIELTEEEWDTIRGRITLAWMDTTPDMTQHKILESVLEKIWR